MYIKKNVDLKNLIRFGWRAIVGTTALSTIAWFAYDKLNLHWSAIPYAPVSTIGTAVAICVGFKNNSSYDRLWEARKIWGEITNLSRSFAAHLLAVSDDIQTRNRTALIVHRQILFVNVLRTQLRKHAIWENTQYLKWSKRLCVHQTFEKDLGHVLSKCTNPEERNRLSSVSNPAREIMRLQIASITALKRDGLIDAYDASDLVRLCSSLIDQQGKSERIKNFPFPRQYASLSEMLVYLFVVLLPFGLLPEFAKLNSGLTWMVIPLSALIAWIFTSMEQAGDTSENPFENGINDVPMTAICRQIEIDLLEMLGEERLPPPVTHQQYVLM